MASKRSLKDGRWLNVTSPEEHESLKGYGALKPKEYGFARVQIGNYNGPGRYMLLQYSQRCPRNCCYDEVNEVLTPEQVVIETKREIIELVELLRVATVDRPQVVYLIEKLIETDYKVPYAVCMFEDQAKDAVENLGYGYSYRELLSFLQGIA